MTVKTGFVLRPKAERWKIAALIEPATHWRVRSDDPTFELMNQRRPFLLLLTLIITVCTHAQSISGNLNAGSMDAVLGFGNVDIYRGDELVASVLTDRHGNFNVRLDTGLYRCVVSYDGYESSTRMVRVEADEKVDFGVAKEKGTPTGKPRTAESRVMKRYALAEDAMEYHMASAGSGGYRPTPGPRLPAPFGSSRRSSSMGGVLTAGEVNDFAKWTQWGDLSQDVLSGLNRHWGIAPAGRYAVDLQTVQGLPLADAQVLLQRMDGTVLYRARTDNTGKAELWATLDAADTSAPGPLQVAAEYAGSTYRLHNARPFANGMNRFVLDVPCHQSNAVDVAFVVDATGSMQDEIDFLKAELNDIIFQSKRIGDRLNFRFANVFYRDVGPGEEYTTRTMDFTRVLSTAVNFISGQGANGGGDEPEAVEIALDSTINRLTWSAEARARILFLVLDAGPHLTPDVKLRMRELTAQASAKGIRIVPVAASGLKKDTEYLLRCLALGTNGTYTFLTDHSGVGNPHMEPSTDKYDVESLNGLLVRILKSFTYMPDCQQQLPHLALDYPDSAVTAALAPDSTVSVPEGGTSASTLNWSYWPNPTSGLIHIATDTGISELHITDLGGKVLQVVKQIPPGTTMEVDLRAYATGIYLLRYPVGTGWASGKVILTRG